MKQLRRLSKVYSSLGVSRGVAYAWARKGKMPAICINGIWLVDVEQFERWLSSHHVEQARAVAVQDAKRSSPGWKSVAENPPASPGAAAISAKRERRQTIDYLSKRTGLSHQFVSNNFRRGVPTRKLLAKLDELGVNF